MRRVAIPLSASFAGLMLIPAAPLLAAQGDVKLSGFVTAAYSQLDQDEPFYLGRINDDGDWGDTHFGLNAHADLGDDWQVAGQLFASGTEPAERYNLVLDWAYITKRFTDTMSASAGKIKYPNLLVSEYVDVGIAYPWIRPPEELYRYETLGVNLSLESFEGASFNFRSSANVDIAAQIYVGQAGAEDGDLNQMMGLKASVGTEEFLVQAAYNQHTLRLDPGSERADLTDEDASVVSAGAFMDKFNVVAYAEYAEGEAEDVTTEAYYLTLGYRIQKFLPHITVAEASQDDWGQESVTIGLKYQVTASADIKFEYKEIDATAEEGEETYGLFEEDGGEPEDGTAQLISVAVDVVF